MQEIWTICVRMCFSHYVGAQPVLLVSNLGMLKQIMVKQFDNFVDRSVSKLQCQQVCANVDVMIWFLHVVKLKNINGWGPTGARKERVSRFGQRHVPHCQ